jgi:uncharacterized protein
MNFFSFSLTHTEILIILSVALLTGMAKTGVHGAGMLSVPMLAVVFGGQLSSGVLLPMLVMADVFGVWYYHRHASWQHLKILFPWAAVGVVAGTVLGKYMDDSVFKIIMASTILISVVIMIVLERMSVDKIPKQKSFAVATGIAGGFTSMVGNLAGSVMSVYLLSVRLPKNAFIGTTAWFFLVVNWFKVPFHVFAWHTITWNTVLLDLLTLPVILLGAWLGILLVKQLSDTMYRWFIIGMTLIAAIGMLV